jgi:hypothetical protein
MHYSNLLPKCVSALVQHTHVDGGEKKSVTLSKKNWEIKARTLIMCFSYKVSQLLAMYQLKQMWFSWWPFSSLCKWKRKHQKRKNKNACCTSTQKGYKICCMNEGMGNLDGRHQWYLLMQSMHKWKKGGTQ